MAYKAMEIANYVLGYYVIEKDDFISNLKLQKVLYFLQANHLVETGNPLFEDEIEAWDFGPVIVEVYNRYKMYGASSIPFDFIDRNHDYKKHVLRKDMAIMNDLLDELISISSTSLLETIHNQKPWEEGYFNPRYMRYVIEDGKIKKIRYITNDLLYDYFK